MKNRAACALLVWATAVFHAETAQAQGADTAAPLAGLQRAGEGTLRVWGLEIYRARLWVSPGFAPADYAALPLALELSYARSFSAAAIAERSIAEMRRAGPFSAAQATRWQQALQAALRDVQPGDRITGLYQPGRGATFRMRGRTVGTVADPEFARLFFGIWLAPQTSEPGLRAELLGTEAPP
ncbi:chalcone isomerase family protein [Acidovorax sp. SRB_24]|uniref:chalcone isomerase family protein n=1 Tax=Acidovorax sp. SRB_24 TaxID=1962700 RepID=UPI00145D7D85|nr:chalcone isomerase family protein [Acidovorax sp. SRB_24]NMM76589.1 hypothetical protein [Acidovorax sp. SRB_24]